MPRPWLQKRQNPLLPGRTLQLALSVAGSRRDSPGGRVFDNTGEALSAVAEMRDLIREQNLDPRAAIELMANRAQEITGCCGTTVGLFKQNTVVYPVRTGIGATMAGLELHSNFFRSCVQGGAGHCGTGHRRRRRPRLRP